MTVRRQMLNLGGKHTDFRVGEGAFDDLPRMLKATVNTPRRAFLAAQPLALSGCGESIRRGLSDAGFSVVEFALPDGAAAADLGVAARLFEALDREGITAEDLICGVGDASACAVASFCAGSWLGGTAFALLPTTLDAMVSAPTSMRPISAGCARDVVSFRPSPTLVVCDLDLLAPQGSDALALGRVQIVSAYLIESKRFWQRADEVAEQLASGDPLLLVGAICDAQTARVNALKATSPSARHALLFGTTTARALRGLLGAGVPAGALLAEGMRFEARVAVDACGFEVDDVFRLDDCLETAGVEELAFDLDPDDFVEALKADRFRRANRFMLPLPKRPGFIRLSTVDDAVLATHAEAYLASRAELLEEE